MHLAGCCCNFMVNIYQIGFPGHHNVIYLMIKFKLAVDMTK